jgi:hypothetical protein
MTSESQIQSAAQAKTTDSGHHGVREARNTAAKRLTPPRKFAPAQSVEFRQLFDLGSRGKGLLIGSDYHAAKQAFSSDVGK